VQLRPFWAGLTLTVINPYFLVWWATVGLTLTGQAIELGLVALGLFAAAHWLCDLVWLELLSQVGFKGAELLGKRAQRIVFVLCAVMLLLFGMKFIWDASNILFVR
jgi:threonine/homoserine/homoserine lactone efflux protein